MTKIEKAIFGDAGYKGTLIKKKAKTSSISKSKIRTIVPKSMTSIELRRFQYENMSEEEHQQEFIKWLDDEGIYFEIGLEGIFLPNPHDKQSRAFQIQAASNKKVLSKMRLNGMRKGVSDIKIYLDEINLHIELKRVTGGIISPEQKRTHTIINARAYSVHKFCCGFAEAKSFVLCHYKIKQG